MTKTRQQCPQPSTPPEAVARHHRAYLLNMLSSIVDYAAGLHYCLLAAAVQKIVRFFLKFEQTDHRFHTTDRVARTQHYIFRDWGGSIWKWQCRLFIHNMLIRYIGKLLSY